MGSRTDDRRLLLITSLGLSSDIGADYSISDLEMMYAAGPYSSGVVFDGVWQDMTPLVNGWVAGGVAPQFMKDSRGRVFFRGQLTGVAAATGAFTLPVGYRPIGTLYAAGQVAPNNGFINAAGVLTPKQTAGVVGDIVELNLFMFGAV